MTQSDDKLIIDGLSNLAMKLNESTGELLARITNTMVIIKESYATYENKIEAPQHNANGGYLDATATKWKNNSVNNVKQFFKMQLFRAALPGDICKVVAQHDQNSYHLGLYQVATIPPREKLVPGSRKQSQPSTRQATPTQRTTKRRLLLSKTGETRNSATTKLRDQTQCNLAINNFRPAPATTPTGTGSTVSTARSRTTPKMNAKKEFMKTSHAETNKDVPIGLKCT